MIRSGLPSDCVHFVPESSMCASLLLCTIVTLMFLLLKMPKFSFFWYLSEMHVDC